LIPSFTLLHEGILHHNTMRYVYLTKIIDILCVEHLASDLLYKKTETLSHRKGTQ